MQGKQIIQFKKCAKDLNRDFSKEDIQRAQRHMKGYSASLAIREMPINTTMRYHFTPVRTAIINKSTNTSAGILQLSLCKLGGAMSLPGFRRSHVRVQGLCK